MIKVVCLKFDGISTSPEWDDYRKAVALASQPVTIAVHPIDPAVLADHSMAYTYFAGVLHYRVRVANDDMGKFKDTFLGSGVAVNDSAQIVLPCPPEQNVAPTDPVEIAPVPDPVPELPVDDVGA